MCGLNKWHFPNPPVNEEPWTSTGLLRVDYVGRENWGMWVLERRASVKKKGCQRKKWEGVDPGWRKGPGSEILETGDKCVCVGAMLGTAQWLDRPGAGSWEQLHRQSPAVLPDLPAAERSRDLVNVALAGRKNRKVRESSRVEAVISSWVFFKLTLVSRSTPACCPPITQGGGKPQPWSFRSTICWIYLTLRTFLAVVHYNVCRQSLLQ